MVSLLEAEIVPFDAVQLVTARQAYREFGRGSGHRASLNMGDCFSYALAKIRGLPLLFKGDDFIHTDIAQHWGGVDDPVRQAHPAHHRRRHRRLQDRST